jgi:hypothetical protein
MRDTQSDDRQGLAVNEMVTQKGGTRLAVAKRLWGFAKLLPRIGRERRAIVRGLGLANIKLVRQSLVA